MNTWILCADRAHARVYFTPGRHLQLLQSVEHPEGRLHDSEIATDQAGQEQARSGHRPHALATHESPSETVARRFAKELATLVHDGRVDGRFDHLVLVAEPSFLGLLDEALDDATRTRVTAKIGKRLIDVAPTQLAKTLRDVIPTLEA
jgi:protein required for attachment to host cells